MIDGIVTNKTLAGFIVEITRRPIVLLTGPDAQDLLQRLSTNDMSKITAGSAVQTILTNEKGRIIEVVSVIKLAEGKLLLVGQSQDGARLLRWLEKFIIMEDAKLESQAGLYKHFLLYGMQDDVSLLEKNDEELLRDAVIFKERWKNVTLMHLLVEHSRVNSLLDQLRKASYVLTNGEDFERFRIQSYIPSCHSELTQEYNPLEANLNHLISWTKGCYIGQEVIARLDTYKKVQRKLVGLRLEEMPTSLPHTIFTETEEVGMITSAIEI
ncbi:MAG: hypothetical protein HY089_06340, partial [Ignavibacteriales bacterium]|nr:hypothetical protein [Ignavibacteriales bacterium]